LKDKVIQMGEEEGPSHFVAMPPEEFIKEAIDIVQRHRRGIL